MSLHAHSEATPGRKGATRASYDENNPRVLVKRIMDRYPQAALPEIQRRVRKAIEGDDCDFRDAFIDWTTTNAHDAIMKADQPRAKPTRPTKGREGKPIAERIAEQAELAATVSSFKQTIKDAWRLEVPAPNGKAIGDCTGLEGAQFTGYYKAVFDGVGAEQKLRSVKTGADLAKVQTWKD